MPEDSTAMSRATPGARRTARHAVAALALAAASLLLYLSNGRPSVGGDALPAELLPVSLLREGDFDYDEFAPELREGYMYARVNDRTISFYPVVPGLLNVPAHWLASGGDADLVARRRDLAKTTAATLTALSVGCGYLALAAVCLRWTTALLLAGFYAVGTLTWSVASNTLWQHGPSLLLLSAGMACFLSRRPFWMAAAGFWLGLAVFNRPSNAVFLLPVGIYLLVRHRRVAGGFAVAAALPLAAMAWYSWTYWGSVWALGQGHRWRGRHGYHDTHFNLAAGFVRGLLGTLFSPNRGLFAFSPALVLSVPAAARLAVRPDSAPELVPLAAGAGLHLLLHSSWSVWWAGWSFGYRLLIEALPVLVLLAAVGWERWIAGHAWRVAGIALLGAWSVYAQFLGAYYYPSGWNGDPDIDLNPGRCWSFSDTEVGRLHRQFLRQPPWRRTRDNVGK